MMKSQRSNIERSKLIENGKIIGIDEIIWQNERINNSLKFQVKNNVWIMFENNCLKCKKMQKAWIQEFQNLVIIMQCFFYQNVSYAVVKKQDLLRK